MKRRMRPEASSKVRQEVYCHECGGYVQFEVDMLLNGQHIVNCPRCGHEHYRYVRNGRISDRRWGSANRQQVYGTVHRVSVATWSSASTTTTTTYNPSSTAASIDTNFWYPSSAYGYGTTGSTT